MTEYQIQVYKIWYADAPDDFYIGSTKLRLSARMAKHRSKVRSGSTSKLYTLMREKGINNFEYVLVATCMVRSVDEQRQFEQQLISELKPTLNTNRAFITEEQRKEAQKEYDTKPGVKAKKKEYYAKPEYKANKKEYNKGYEAQPETKQKRKEYRESIRRTCICGVIYRSNSYYSQTHYNSKHHIDYVADFKIRLATLLEKK